MGKCEAPAPLGSLNLEDVKAQPEIEKLIKHNRHRTPAGDGSNNGE